MTTVRPIRTCRVVASRTCRADLGHPPQLGLSGRDDFRSILPGRELHVQARRRIATLTPAEVAALSVSTLVTPPATLWLCATVPLAPVASSR